MAHVTIASAGIGFLRGGRSALAAACVCAYLLAAAPAASGSKRALIPDAAERVSAAFARTRPALSLETGFIDHDHVDATLCAAKDDCFSIRLDDPAAGCGGESAGPFCLTFPAARDARAHRPTSEEVAVLRAALATVDGTFVWRELVDAPRRPRDPPGVAATIAIALALVVVPCGAGAAAGAAARRAFGRRLAGVVPALAALAVPLIVALVVGRPPGPIGFWDAALAALMAGAAFVWTAHRAFEERGQRWLTLGSATIACLVAEAGVRLLLPAPPGFPSARETRLFAAPNDSQGQALICNTTYGSAWPVDRDDRTLRADAYRVPTGFAHKTLFVGDSMTWGVGVGSDETFPALLAAAEPTTLVVNGAASAIGPDGYLVLLRQWLPRLEPELVVFGLFDGNDLDDIDAPYPCCGDRPLLTYGPDGPRLRCPEPSVTAAALGVRAYLASPPPYLLRVLAGSSSMAAFAATAFARLATGPVGERDGAGATAHLEAILRAARDEVAERNGAFVVLLLPTRADLEATDPKTRRFRGYGLKMADVARRLGIPVLDSWELFEAAVQTRGSTALFADVIHLGAAGHRLLADWLVERLPTAAAAAHVQAEDRR